MEGRCAVPVSPLCCITEARDVEICKNQEKIDLEKRAQDYAVRNKALIDAEERALSAARQEGLNVVALKQQVADLCQRLEGLTQEAESKFKREREYEQELMVGVSMSFVCDYLDR